MVQVLLQPLPDHAQVSLILLKDLQGYVWLKFHDFDDNHDGIVKVVGFVIGLSRLLVVVHPRYLLLLSLIQII